MPDETRLALERMRAHLTAQLAEVDVMLARERGCMPLPDAARALGMEEPALRRRAQRNRGDIRGKVFLMDRRWHVAIDYVESRRKRR